MVAREHSVSGARLFYYQSSDTSGSRPMTTHVLKLLVASILVVNAVACQPAATTDDVPSVYATPITSMTVDEVVAAAQAGKVTTFEAIIAAMVVINRSRPRPKFTGLDDNDEAGIEKAIREFSEVEWDYFRQVQEPFLEALEGMRVSSWQGWIAVTGKERGADTFGASIYILDPYSDNPHSLSQYADETEAADTVELLGLTQAEAEKLHAGDKVTFNGEI